MSIERSKPALTRRSFIAGTAGTGLVMTLGATLPGCSREDAAQDIADTGASRIFSPSVWFEIDAEGAINVNIAKAEMGQHVGTALARIVADELGADWARVSLTHVDSDPKWGYMVTGGSWSVVTSFTMLSQAGAAGRTVLAEAGAALLGVAADDVTVEEQRSPGWRQQRQLRRYCPPRRYQPYVQRRGTGCDAGQTGC